MHPDMNLLQISKQLADGEVSAKELTSACLSRIEDPGGEGSRTIIRQNALVLEEAARVDAERAQAKRMGRTLPSLLHGIPLTVKDLFDIKGQVTTAGSRVLRDSPPAERDSDLVALYFG